MKSTQTCCEGRYKESLVGQTGRSHSELMGIEKAINPWRPGWWIDTITRRRRWPLRLGKTMAVI